MTTRRHGKRRKKLCVGEDEFFTAVVLAYGKPDPNARHYLHTEVTRNGFHFVSHGVGAYLQHDPRGRLFTQLVLSFGEAKCRASKLYYAYCQWCKKHGVIPAKFELEI